jgi:NADH-quinone oxidoreductase subunit J
MTMYILFWIVIIAFLSLELAFIGLTRNLWQRLLIGLFFCFQMAGLFIFLQADYLAAILIIASFGLTTMFLLLQLLWPVMPKPWPPRWSLTTIIRLVIIVLLGSGLAWAVHDWPGTVKPFKVSGQNLARLSFDLASRYLVPLELLGLLSMIVMIGMVILLEPAGIVLNAAGKGQSHD